jgi:tRNA threonylcarbamoyladenosine modification (KEOPS) complex  Pcc1 subunit
VLEYDDARVAKAVAAAVSPDNLKTPSDMSVTTMLNGNAVTTEIDFKGKMETFIATIDDLLFCIAVAEKAINTMKL